MQLSSDENRLDSFTKAKMAGLERFAKEFVTISGMKARKSNIDRPRKLANVFVPFLFLYNACPRRRKLGSPKVCERSVAHV